MVKNKSEILKPFHIGLLSAMPQELGSILDNLINIKEINFGDLKLYSGIWKKDKNNDVYITTGWSGWGKVSAARATTRLCSAFYKDKEVDLILFTGVAGAVKDHLKQWDIIIPDYVIQYDMDSSPLFEKYIIPALNKKKLNPPKKLYESLTESLKVCKKNGGLNQFGQIYNGLIGTGDQFISDKNLLKKLSDEIEDIYAVEMEGAAFAQVAIQEKIDWIIMRVISDSANDSAADDFNYFLKSYERNSWELIESFLNFYLIN